MAEIKEFVINDRRKFTPEGEVRPDAPPSEPRPARPETLLEPTSDEKFGSSAKLVDSPAEKQAARQVDKSTPIAPPKSESVAPVDEGPEPPPLTAEQTSAASQAYDATVDRLDTAIRATNPGAERMPEMTFERVVQSIYMQALMQLGAAAPPGQQPHVDVLGARQTIDMLAAIAGKTTGNLNPAEATLVDNALFELRMGFLEVTQALARQAQQAAAKQPPPPGPSIVR